MLDPRRHAAALLAALLLAAPASALAQQPLIVAQIDDATPTPTAEGQPPLSEEPPEELDGGDEDASDAEDESSPAGSGSKAKNKPLPDTGIEAGLVALLGLGLLASGSGLRVSLRREA